MRKRTTLLGGAALASIFALIACVGDEPAASSESDGGASESGTSDATSGGDAGPTCVAPLVSCGTACVDPSSFDTDSKNCGSCGHDCLGGGCSAKACGSTTVLVASGADAAASSISSMGFDGTHVVYLSPIHPSGVSSGVIYSCDLPTCSTPAIDFDGHGFGEIDAIATSTNVPGVAYYTSNNNDGIYRVTADGGNPDVTPTQCATNDPNCEFLGFSSMYTLTIDDGTAGGVLFGTSLAGGSALFASLPNGAGQTQFGGNYSSLPPTAVAVAQGESPRHWMYALIGPNASNGKVVAYDVTNTNEGTAVPSLLYSVTAGTTDTYVTGGLAVAGGNVFWTQNDGSVQSLATCTSSCPTNPRPTLIAKVAGSSVMLGSGSKIVWAAGSSVYECPASGCSSLSPAPIASTPHRITALAEDAVSIFWGDELGGIYRLAK